MKLLFIWLLVTIQLSAFSHHYHSESWLTGGGSESGYPLLRYDAYTFVAGPTLKEGTPLFYNRLIGSASFGLDLNTIFQDDGGTENLSYELVSIESADFISGHSLVDGLLTVNFADGKFGSAAITVKAVDEDNLSVEYSFDLRVIPKPTPIVRINSGGERFGSWQADSYYVDGFIAPVRPLQIENTDLDFLYQTERWSETFSYEIPVPTTGYYKLDLLFAEIFHGISNTNGIGARVFDVFVEGEKRLSSYDIFLEADGPAKAITESIDSVHVTDGNLSLNFSAIVENAKISAIQISKYTLEPIPNADPIVENPGDRFAVNGQFFELQIDASDSNLDDSLSYSATGLPSSLSIDEKSGKISGTIDSSLEDYNVMITVDDGNGGIGQVSFVIKVVELVDYIFRLNAGANTVLFGEEVWVADDFFSDGIRYSTSAAISKTANDEIYQTERFGNAFTYQIPVPQPGNYTVTLHFAEIFWKNPGERIFNVDVENGQGLLTNYDIIVAAGGFNTAVSEVFEVNITDGFLTISLTSVVDNAKLSAIEFVGCIEPSIQSFTASSTEICRGQSTTLTVDGNLANSTIWKLYSGSCGGTLVDANATGVFVVSPESNTTYFVRAEGGCAPLACMSLAVAVKVVNTAISLDGTTLTASAEGAVYQWVDCGTGLDIPGATDRTYSPPASGSFSVRITEDGCTLTSSCVDVCFIPFINTFTASETEVCQGSTITLTVTGGLGGGATWALYSGSCGGTLVATGASGVFEIVPSSSTTYFVRAQGGCVIDGACASVSIIVNFVDTGIAIGGTTLTASATNATYQWIDCDSGNDVEGATERVFEPPSDGSYAVRVTQDGCTAVSSCVGFVRCDEPVLDSFTASALVVCAGETVTLTVVGELESATAWHLYSGSCGGTFIEANTSGVFEINPAVSATYFVRGEGGCVIGGTCASVEITVNPVETNVTKSGNTLTASATGATYQWINCNGNIEISGATSKTFSPEESGSYSVRVTQNGCTETSDCIDFTIVGLSETLSKMISVYPNPGNTRVKIELPVSANELAIQIADIQGRIVLEQLATDTAQAEIDLTGLNKGIYIIQIRTENLMKTVKYLVH